jgi:hypothetical protein
MNVNFGLMPPLEGRIRKTDRKTAYTDRARDAFARWTGADVARSELVAVAVDDRAVAVGDERG